MYKSPIDISFVTQYTNDVVTAVENDVVTTVENAVMSAVIKCGINVDKDELVRALMNDRNQYVQGYRDAKAELICCKDCKHYDGRPCGIVDFYNTDNDYCSRAERRKG